MARIFSVLAASFATVRAGSGCNEVVEDPGPWIEQLEIQKTEEGFDLSVALVGGAVAASSTESVELLLLARQRKHLVLSKLAARKAVLELRTEEELPCESFSLEATLAEYNGNAHGPEKMSCVCEAGHYSCSRVAKAAGTAGTGAEGHMQHGQGMPQHPQGVPQHGQDVPQHGQGMQGMQGMRGAGAHSPPTAAPAMMGIQQAMLRPLVLGASCSLGTSSCPSGSQCQASAQGFTCQVPEVQESRHLSGRALALGTLALGACVCAALRCRGAKSTRSFEDLPKVVGKMDGELPVRTKFHEVSDSDEEYRVF